MNLTKRQEEHYAQMRYHAELKRQEETAKIWSGSIYGKFHNHIHKHQKVGDFRYSACDSCRSYETKGFELPDEVKN